MPSVQQPDWNQQPIFNQTFAYNLAEGDGCEAITIDPRRSEYCPDFSSVTTGGGDVFISSSGIHDPGAIRIYDGTTLAHKRTIQRSDLDLPRGIAWYKGELFVVDAGTTNVLVFDPATGNLKRTIAHLAKAVIAANYVEKVALSGIDAAWGELWISFLGDVFGGGVTVVDAQTGAPKGIHWHQARSDSRDFNWWDIATVPEVGGVLAQCRFISRVDVAHPIPVDEVQVDELGGTNACAKQEQPQGGIDAVWGMRWLLAVEEPREGQPLRINEYGIENGGATAPRLSPLRRSWRPRMTEPNQGEYLHHDVAYQARDARIDWDGAFTTTNWLRGTHCANYIVSDADIYVAGEQAERWYEPARGFQKIEFQVDGVTRLPAQTTPSGQFCFDTSTMPSGTHTVTLKAWVNDGSKIATISNGSTNFDNTGPAGAVTSPGAVVTGPVTVKGSMVDPHSGSKEWVLEASLNGGPWKTVCTIPGNTQGVNQWAPECLWAAGTPDYPEGVYQLRSRMTDMVTPAYGGANVGYSAPVTVRVDKSPPTATFSGELKDAEDLRPLYNDDAPAVAVTGSDNPGAGVKRLEFYVDSVQRDAAEQACPGGNCSMTRTFTLRPGEYGEGRHTITVRVIDQANHSRDYQWQVDIEQVFAPDPDGTDLPPVGMEDDPIEPEGGGASAMSTPEPFLNAEVEGSPIPPDELLPCSDDEDVNFPVYSVGQVFEGLPMSFSYRRCDVPWPEEPERANFVSFIYGNCQAPTGEDPGGCAPPLEVQSWPTCERNLASYQGVPGVDPMPYAELQVAGVTGASFDDGLRVEVFTGRTTVVIFGQDAAQVLRAANSLQQQAQSDPLGLPAAQPRTALADPLPEPLQGIVNGGIPCV